MDFTFTVAGVAQTGTMPIARAEILADPANLAATTARVVLDAGAASATLPFVTEALRGPAILDSARFPGILFESTSVRLAPDGRLSGGATITGRLTLRGVTRSVMLDAGLYRPPGAAPDDLSRLIVTLSGQLSRSAFGITAHAGLVADAVGIDIRAVLDAEMP